MRLFTGRVPGEFFAIDAESATVLCPCKPDTTPVVPFNVVTPCTGDCGRWFLFTLSEVLVATMPGSAAASAAAARAAH